VCNGGTPITLLNIGTGVSVTWSTSSNMNIVSGQGSSSSIIKAASSSTSGAGTINATVSCPNTTVAPVSVWVGSPTETGLDMAVRFGPSSNQLCWNVTLGVAVTNTNHSTQHVNDYVWNHSSFASYFVGYDVSFPYGNHGVSDFKVNNTAPTTARMMSVLAKNTCGNSLQYWEAFTALDCQGGVGGGKDRSPTTEEVQQIPEVTETLVYPVPANDKIIIEVVTPSVLTSVVVYNSSSLKVLEMNSSDSKFSVPVINLSEGLYYLVIANSKEHQIKRIFIKH
jgi:hypothetical protein